MKTLAIAAAAGLMLLAAGTAAVLTGHTPASAPSRIHLSAASGSQPDVSPSQTSGEASDADEQSEAAEDEQGADEPDEDDNQQGPDEDHQGGATNQQGTAGQSER